MSVHKRENCIAHTYLVYSVNWLCNLSFTVCSTCWEMWCYSMICRYYYNSMLYLSSIYTGKMVQLVMILVLNRNYVGIWFAYSCTGEEVSSELIELMSDSLKLVETQPASSDKYAGLDKRPATYSVVKKARDNDPDLHTDKTMYSCGSLAPKMGKGGCMNSTFRREAEPWETAEGWVIMPAADLPSYI